MPVRDTRCWVTVQRAEATSSTWSERWIDACHVNEIMWIHLHGPGSELAQIHVFLIRRKKS